MKQAITLTLYLLCGVFATTSIGQRLPGEKPKPCNNQTARKGNFKTLSVSLGTEVQFYIEVKKKDRTDENYRNIAREFREKYCEETQLRVIYLTGKKQMMIRDLKDLDGTPLAIFYAGKGTGEEVGIVVYSVNNGKVEWRKLSFDP